jgi:hypothetical protein
MKLFLIAVAFATMSTSAVAADVGVSVSIGQPGYYGRIDIGNAYPQPQVIYAQPRVIMRHAPMHEPIYLRVPPGHRKNWKKHCRQYGACGERVYFVQDNWYQRDYAPRYQQYHRDRHDGHNQYRGDDRRDDHRGGNDRRDDHRGDKGDDRGNGHR